MTAFEDHPPGLALAEKIEKELQESNAQAGDVYASVAELQARHQVGRPVFRQALRVLEERGVAYMRRGAGGGVIVSPPSPAFAGRAISILIQRHMKHLLDVGTLPVAVDGRLFTQGSYGLDWRTCDKLRRMARRLDNLSDEEFLRVGGNRQLFDAIRNVSDEPIINLAQTVIVQCTNDLVPYSINRDSQLKSAPDWALTLETLEALIAGDVRAMFSCQERQIQLYGSMIENWEENERNLELSPRFDVEGQPDFLLSGNRADQLAREILREIRLLNWEAGARIGSGAELVRKYKVAPAILRQAVLLLQEHNVIEVVKGRNGGLCVSKPDRAVAIDAARDFLRKSNESARNILLFWQHLAVECLSGFRAPDHVGLQSCGRGLQAEARAGNLSVRENIWALTASLSENPVLQIFTELLSPWLSGGGDPEICSQMLVAGAAGDLTRCRRLVLETVAREIRVADEGVSG